MLPTQAKLATVILSNLPTNFWKLVILLTPGLTPKYKEFSNKKLNGNDARRLALTTGDIISPVCKATY